MIRFSQRQALLLQLLSEVDHPIKGTDLAGLLGVSTRTLRYDIARINGISRDNIIESTTNGYSVEQSVYTGVVARNSEFSTQLEHHERILLYLFDTPDTTIYDVMRDCYLSESVIKASLKRLKPQFEDHSLHLSLRGSSIHLDGNEIYFRNFLGSLVNTAMDAVVGQNDKVNRYLPDVRLGDIENLVVESLRDYYLEIDDIRLSNMIVNIAICVQRYSFPIEDNAATDLMMSNQSEMLCDQLLVGLRKLYPERPLSSADDAYLRSIVGATLGFGHGELDHHSDSCDIYSTVSRCLDDTVEHFGLVIAKEELYGSVSKHVGRLMAHAPSMPYFRNTLRESLRSRSPFLYDAAVYLADKLSRLLGIFFTDDEIGLLAIYIGLYSEPAPNPNLVTAVVVCPRYQALRDVLLAGLVDHFANRMRIVDIVSSVAEVDMCDGDIVISTTEEPSHHHTCVPISALMSDLDLSAIDSALLRASEKKSRIATASAMKRFLDPTLFFTGRSFDSWRETLDFMCGSMERNGIVPDAFRESIFLREGYSSTVFFRTFAVPHAMDFLAYETKIAVLIPSTPINWETSDVSLVLLLAINEGDYDDFVRFYQPLISVLYDRELFTELRSMSSYHEFMKFLDKQISM